MTPPPDTGPATGPTTAPATGPDTSATTAPDTGPATGPRTNPDLPLLTTLQKTFDETLEAQLEKAFQQTGAREVALVNFPNHGNPGDSLIWLGAEAALRRLNVKIQYRCAWYHFNPHTLNTKLPDPHAPVLLNGGGNFGDLYTGQQELRERLLKQHRDRTLIQLPQSIHFRAEKNLRRNQRLVAKHPNVTLMLRDQSSLEFARATFDAPAVLAPDAAFGAGPLTLPKNIYDDTRGGKPGAAPAATPRPDILWLHRLPSDPEYVDYGIAQATQDLPYTVAEVEWLRRTPYEPRIPRADRAIRKLNKALRPRAAAHPRVIAPLLTATFDRYGWSHVNRGLAILAAGRVLVTDKLHGHIMALAAGIPHVVLNNSYGKVAGAYRTWTHPSTLAHYAESGAQAVELATALLEGNL